MSAEKKRIILPPDQDGRYDMDGQSYDNKLGVVLGSDATSSKKDASRLAGVEIVKTPLWRRWLDKALTHGSQVFSAKNGQRAT